MIDLDWDQGGSMEVVRIGKKKKKMFVCLVTNSFIKANISDRSHRSCSMLER